MNNILNLSRGFIMKKYAKVIVRSNTIYTDNLFTYQIPVFLSDVIKLGTEY